MTAPATHPTAVRALNAATRSRFAQHCRPKPRLSLSEWAERHVVLPSETTHRAGTLRLAVTPYLREVMDAVSDRRTQQVTFIAPSQSAKTTFVIAVALYFVHQEPAPILIVQPTVEMAEDFSKTRLTPTINASPAIAPLFPPPRSRDSTNTIRSKHAGASHLDMAGANSPAGLASRPKRVVLLDEVDRYPDEAGSEGDPFSIAYARTRSYQRARKVVAITSPTDEPVQDADGRWHGSRGWREYLGGTREVWQQQCPKCGHWQVLQFKRLEWETTDGVLDRASLHYPCEACNHPIREQDRPTMAGRFHATRPEAGPRHRSFHLTGLSAGFALWDELAAEYLARKGDPSLYKTFVNTALGEVWRDTRIETQKDALRARAKRYAPNGADWQVPREGAILTAGVDVQHDRLELVVRAWGTGEESWLVERAILRGDTSQPHVWATLEQYRTERSWKHELGARLRIRAMCVDAGDGAYARTVYHYCAPRLAEHVYAIKGSSQLDAPLIPRKFTKVKPGRLYLLGVNGLTERIYRRLAMPAPGAGYLHLNEYADDDYVTQLLSEVRKRDPKTGRRRWVLRANARNEVLDCEKYALAALLLGPVPVASLAEEVTRVADEGSATAAPRHAAPKPTPARGGWLPPRRGGWL